MKLLLLSALVLTATLSAQARHKPVHPTVNSLYSLPCYGQPRVSPVASVLMIVRGTTDEQVEALVSAVLENEMIQIVEFTKLHSGKSLFSFSIGKGYSFSDSRQVNPMVEKSFSDAVTAVGLTRDQVQVSCNGIKEALPRAGGMTGH